MKNITLLDGGVGQEVYKRAGMPNTPLWSAQVMMEKPELVQAVHQDFIKAGARVLTINSYSCTPSRLRRDGKVEWFEQLQRQAFEIAAAAREALVVEVPNVQIAACLPPLIGSYTTDERSFSELKDEYEAIVALQAPKADLFLIETIANTKEAKAAVEAALPAGKPVILSFTLSDKMPGKLRAGEPIEEAVNLMADYALEALLFNCSYPETITEGLKKVDNLNLPYGGYANGFTSIDALKPGGVVNQLSARQDLDEHKYCEEIMQWVESGATVVGGCCEVGPSYIKYISDTLKQNGYSTAPLFQ